MLLSDKLIEIGRKSNPKNNLSMNEAKNLMNSECKIALKDGDMPQRIQNAFTLACNALNKDGFRYFSADKFDLK